jgi:hypothetical protein
MTSRVGPNETAERVRAGADQHLAGLGRRLQPGRRVHDGTGDEELLRRSRAGRRFPGFHAHAHLEPAGERELLAQSPGTVADREPGAHGPQRVVLVHLLQPEDRHDRVADELLGPSPQVQQLLGRRVVEAPQHLAGAFGVEALSEAGRIDEVGEEHGHDLALLGAERARDGGAAAGAEPGVVGQGATADRAGHGPSIGAGADGSGRRSAR